MVVRLSGLLLFLFLLPLTGCTEKQSSGLSPLNDEAPASQTSPPSTESGSSQTNDGEPLVITDSRRADALAAFESLDKTTLEQSFSPADLYGVFNEFALTHFGAANQPLLAKYTGDSLAFHDDGAWQHISVNSAAMAFETSQQTRGRVAYGLAPDALEWTTSESDRYYFSQLHHLTGLEPDTTYYYQIVARRADGTTLRSEVHSFTTNDGSDVQWLSGGDVDQPRLLDQTGATYVLAEDLIATGTAVHIDASDITLDLNGHRIIYANAPQQSVDQRYLSTAASGIWSNRSDMSGIRIVNGQLEEGHVGNKAHVENGGLHAVYMARARDVELAGVGISYHGAQVHGVKFFQPRGRLHVHHNDFVDRGFEILDRHGAGGGRPLRIAGGPSGEDANDFEVNHNLVRRTRHMGLQQASDIHHNEIYMDSWATNSFALQSRSRPDTVAGNVSHNRVFLTGFNPIGLGWAHLDMSVTGNLVQMEGIRTHDRRYSESWGERDASSAFRITNYGSGGQVRDNLQYRDNVILGRARGGSIMRGAMFFTDATITNTLFEDNYVHMSAEDSDTNEVTTIVGQGVTSNQEDHEPAFYINNHLISNVANLRFGDSYGRGNRHIIKDAVLERVGDHGDYHTIVFGGGFESYDHELIDPVFKGGAAYDDVWWRHTSILSNFHLRWTLQVEGSPGAEVLIRDVNDKVVYSGNLDSNGQVDVPLKAVTVRPADWQEGDTRRGVSNRFSSQSIPHGPHQVTVGGETRQVTLTEPARLIF